MLNFRKRLCCQRSELGGVLLVESQIVFPFVLLFVLVLAGCKSDPKQCTGESVSFIRSAGCVMGGGYEAALEQQRNEFQTLVQQVALTQSELASIEALAEKLDGQVSMYHRELDVKDQDLNDLRSEIVELQPKLKEQNVAKNAMLIEIEELQQMLDRARREGDAEREQIRQLTIEVERRKVVLASLRKSVIVE